MTTAAEPPENAIAGDPIWIDPTEEERPWELQTLLPTFAKELLAGGVAGGIAKTAVAPLERVKILFQTKRGSFQTVGLWRSFGIIIREEGIPGFFKGNTASVARVVPYAALHFMAYEQYRRWIVACYHPSVEISPVVDLMAGSIAGATAVVSTYPLDLIRTRLAYQVTSVTPGGAAVGVGGTIPVYHGIGEAFLGIFRQGGVRGLYRGVGPTLWGILPYAGLKFYLYETLKAQVSPEQQQSIPLKLAFGAVSGLVGQTMTYPLDVVRRQMQVQTPPVSFVLAGHSQAQHQQVVFRSTLDGLRTIVRTQGWRQLYAGLSINYIKMVPSVAIGFTIYDGMKMWLRVPPREKRRSSAIG